ncbi:MAG: DNA polymerase III subunit alpha [Alphaproteobacteria bacterium]|nr:DNA polymerase III subunit alpha [Alphaproteobacteria bacterium]
MTEARFIHLHVHSAYSLAEGAIPAKQLVKLCKKNGMPAAAITDTGNLFGAMEFAIEAAKSGIQPILGCEMRLTEAGHEIVLLVQNEVGYRNICRIISSSYLDVDPTHEAHTNWGTLSECAGGLICLTGGIGGPVSQAVLSKDGALAEERLLKLKGIFGDRLYVELQRHGWPQEDVAESGLIELACRHGVPLVATNNCYFPDRAMHEAHDALLCIAGGRYITEEDRRRVTQEHYFKTSAEMMECFKDVPEAIDNTINIARRCSFLLKPIDPILPPFTESGEGEDEELKKQVEAGLRWRLENFVFPEAARALSPAGHILPEAEKEKIAAPYWERLYYELGIINQMGFPGYFLICSDFIKWAKEHNIPVGPGRGSGAGSLVAWSLKITDLDPLRFGLLFERFLNPERVSMPDFDVDFCQDRREEVIRYVQDRYGHDKVAQIITFGKLQARAVVRDVGRVLQMPYGQVDRISKMIPNNPANPITLAEALEQDADLRAERVKDDTTDKLITIALQLEGLYRHASTHAAGLVIGDRTLDKLLPLYRDPRSDMPVTQFNMKFVEQSGLVKFDFLGLKTMTVIQKAVDLIALKGEKIDYLQIPFDDEKTYKLLTDGKTTGVFQLESAGMRDTLRKMRPERLEDIIALVALYRPGPMDNIPLYIDCKEGRAEPDYHHPKLKPYLEETYGIMIYQEQVMQCAQVLAGYSLGGADLLRRAMGKKIKEAMDVERVKFVKGAKEHSDIDEKRANEIFDLLAKFAGYGFNKSHAAAYAVIAYWTAWLKANHPVEFMAASMTLDMHNTDKLSIFKQDLQALGIDLLPPDINASDAEFKVEDQAVRYALAALKGVGEQAMDSLTAERSANGPFKSVDELAERLDHKVLNKRQLEKLVCAGVFDTLEPNRARLFAGIETVLGHAHALAAERESGQNSLFGGDGGSALSAIELPNVPKWDPLEQLQYEFNAVGFYISAHPLDTKAEQLARLGIKTMTEVERELAERTGVVFKMAGVLLKKQEKVSQKSGKKYAFLQVSDPTGVFEATLFSETLAACRDILEAGQTLLLTVAAEQREDQVRYTAQAVELLETRLERTLEEIRLHVSAPAAVRALKHLLDGEGNGRIRLSLVVDAPGGGSAQIELPGRWNFSAASRNAIRKVDGVIEMQEL